MTDCVTRPKPETIQRTPNAECSACRAMRQHTAAEFEKYHPDAGHGFVPDRGWTKTGMEGNR
jgi:hypothetical protein